MIRYIVCFVLFWASMAVANEAPPVPKGGLWFYEQGTCTDQETGQSGYCFMGLTPEGRKYLTFWQDDILMFIREVVGTSYITVWVNDKYNSI